MEEKGPERNDWAFSIMFVLVVLVITLGCLGLNDRGPWQ